MKISMLKYIFFITFLFVFTVEGKNEHANAYANVPHVPNAPNIPIDKQNQELLNLAFELPNYLNTEIVPLSAKEKKALELVNSFAGKGQAPFLSANGKLVYVYGSSIPTIIASPFQVCDIELQQGETINEIIVGDTARWQLDSGQAGGNTHIFVKVVDTGLETSAIVTTNRRVYHLRLISRIDNFTPYIGFAFIDEIQSNIAQQRSLETKQEHFGSIELADAGKQGKLDISDLNFNYEVKGKASWKPERVYDDGQQTFIKLPKKSQSFEMPILLVRKNKETLIVNYRVKETNIIADGIFEEIILVLGVGRSKEQIVILRTK